MSRLQHLPELGEDYLQRPKRMRNGDRDPSPLWDYWYEAMTPGERSRAGKYMADTGMLLDDLATRLYVSPDEAMARFSDACRLQAASAWVDPLSDDYTQADLDTWREPEPLDILGPQELADRYGVAVATIHAWCKRDRDARAAGTGKLRLPEPTMVVSGVPIWTGQALADHDAPGAKSSAA